nr:hypothetical protein [Salmonid herpesvirus 1]
MGKRRYSGEVKECGVPEPKNKGDLFIQWVKSSLVAHTINAVPPRTQLKVPLDPKIDISVGSQHTHNLYQQGSSLDRGSIS